METSVILKLKSTDTNVLPVSPEGVFNNATQHSKVTYAGDQYTHLETPVM